MTRYEIAFYTPSLGPLLAKGSVAPTSGAETQVYLLARALAERGRRVCVVVCDLADASLPPTVDGVDVVVRPVYAGGSGARSRIREGITTARALVGIDASVVVARGAGPSAGIGAATARLCRRRFVYSSSSDFDLGRIETKRTNRRLISLALRLANAIVVQNEQQRRVCRELYGRDPTIIKSVAEPAVAATNPSPGAFLWIGRAIDYKRPLAYVNLARALPEARFQMIAAPVHGRPSADLTAEVIQAAAQTPNLELLRPQQRNPLMRLIQQSVAIVNTSEFEGMPNTFLEGWARGVPALAYSHDPDGVIERHQLGSFAYGSWDGFVSAARALWLTRLDRASLSARCRSYVVEEHSAEVVSGHWMRLLGLGESPIGRAIPLAEAV